MTDRPKLTDDELANLVAFLDGEVDAKTARGLEAKLSLDPQARREAEALKKTFDLLDFLPRPEPSTDFTQKTVTKIAALRPASSSVSTPTLRPGRPWLLGLGWAAAVLMAVAAGYGGGRLLTPKPRTAGAASAELEDQLVQELRLIENKRLYDLIDDIDFLRGLADPDLFGDDS